MDYMIKYWKTKTSRLEGKVAGVIITGDWDRSQYITGGVCNFTHALDMILPHYAILSVQSKDEVT